MTNDIPGTGIKVVILPFGNFIHGPRREKELKIKRKCRGHKVLYVECQI